MRKFKNEELGKVNLGDKLQSGKPEPVSNHFYQHRFEEGTNKQKLLHHTHKNKTIAVALRTSRFFVHGLLNVCTRYVPSDELKTKILLVSGIREKHFKENDNR